MPIFNLFSKRQRIARGEIPDVYIYDKIEQKFRVQVVHITRDALGEDKYGRRSADAYDFIHDSLCREYGEFELTKHSRNKEESLIEFFLSTQDHEKAIDIIELMFKVIDKIARKYDYPNSVNINMTPDEAINELNQRMQEAAIGYRFEDGTLIRIDSELTHAEIIQPVLRLLRQPIYAGANDEFLKAHEHFRHGHLKESINEALKSFESVMKAICDKHSWVYKPSDTAKTLIDICLTNGLIPPFMQSELSSLRALLESGVPTVRNKIGGHGQGQDIQPASIGLTQFALNLAAANILLFAQHENEI